MKTLKFKKIDAFTKGLSSGNPAGYIYLQDNQILSDEEMQRIAFELKGFVSEVGYINQNGDGFDLRYYSAECEVAFCGHATIAIMYDLLSSQQDLRVKEEILIHVQAGTLSVFNRIDEDDAVYIMAPPPKYLESTLTPAQIAGVLDISLSEINTLMPIRLIDGGLRTLIVPLTTLESCLQIFPDQEKLKQFCMENDIDIIHISTNETHLPSCTYRTRVFAPRFGYLEDPATGSGNAAFGYYLLDENLWNNDFTIEQGPDRVRPNLIKLKRHEKDGVIRILFGGSATTRIEGIYCLQ